MADLKPVRLRLSRKPGFDLQALSLATNGLPAVNVARPSRWGNPFTAGDAKDLGFCPCNTCLAASFQIELSDSGRRRIREFFKGKNVACWCPPGPCHGDVILDIAAMTDRQFAQIVCEPVHA